jgi:hypothetical protein
MFQEKISFEQALLLEKENKIVIYNPNVVESIYSNVKEWQDNWNTLRKTFRKVPVQRLSSFANFEYLIEHKFIENSEPVIVNWVYMYGQDISTRVKLNESNSKGRYVYVLTNVAYPDICKIGKAVTPSERVKQINGAGIVSEWVLKYALPVTDDFLVENLVHQMLENLRLSSHQGSSREFFSISLEEAISTIERIGENFATAKPIYY